MREVFQESEVENLSFTILYIKKITNQFKYYNLEKHTPLLISAKDNEPNTLDCFLIAK